ncbi:MAG TPA: DUF6588 family protein [Balneolales bacterium]|nr:DUF6588 family protein [Balneolales bacterium]
MKLFLRNAFKSIILFALLALVAVNVSYAQLNNVGKLIASGKADANILAKEYLSPVGKGFGAGLNTGWFTTAKPHKKLGFDVTVSGGLAFVPTTDQSFDAAKLNLQRLQYDTNSPEMSPTLAGAKQSGSTFNIVDQGYNLGSVTMPKGTGYSFVPSPMFKVGIGLIHDTEIMIRYLPQVNIKNYGKMNLYGFGIKHGLNQWIPGGKLLPVNLSVMFGYTDFKASSDLSVNPQTDANTSNQYDGSTWQGQQVKTETKAYTVNALVGKSLPIIAVYAGVGIESSKMTVATPGNYPITVPDPTQTNPNHKKIDKLSDPVDINIKGANTFHAIVGARLRFLIFSLSASYTMANYSIANVGVGISFR